MSETVRCDNCGKVWVDPDPDEVLTLDKVDDLIVRLDPGSEVPFGECGECGALAYLVQADPADPPAPS